MKSPGESTNLVSAYEGIEDPSSFPDQASLDRYRAALLERTAPQADFLAQHVGAHARVLEIGCGNGRLLIELARRHEIDQALGVDTAASRIAFARSWADDEGLQEVQFEQADAIELNLPEASLTVACCITGAFGYFAALSADIAHGLARKINRALEPRGVFCLELHPHPGFRRLLDAIGGNARLWSELPPDDPWRYYLSDLRLDAERKILTHEKTFIHRTSGVVDAGRREQLYLYSVESITQVLLEAGFRDIQAYEGWSTEPYEDGEIMVVAAVRPSPT
jgi:ubiquinone/menaquinone biosynthesis C-methylase UbiE